MPSTSKNEQTEEQTPEQNSSQAPTKEESPSPLADLDLSNLDLTIESVEERISPSETNVFDK
ncbi:MAG TPA: hypothetical protein EYQ25_09230 [Planctomycetes bacterium]|nr:hypothetical protein [Planctomycetota bacterium]